MSCKVRNKKKQQLEPPVSLITSLPDDVILDILARVPRCYYPVISVVSKRFGKLIASPEIFTRRSLLGCTEHCLYVVLYNRYTNEKHLYILRRKANSNRLVIIQSFPLKCLYAKYVAVGPKIYVFCELDSFSLDCRSHTGQSISDIRNPMSMDNGVADFIDGKIYVIGECLCDDEASGKGKGWRMGVKVYDTETQMWEPEIAKPKIKPGTMLIDNVVMEDKIYMRYYEKTFVYEPKESKWELNKMLNSKEWFGACVIDDELYYYDNCEKKLRVYDPKQKYWKVVNGLEELLPLTAHSWLSTNTGSYGGKLALFFQKYHNAQKNSPSIWCAEIALERRQEEIWGKVQWCDVVLDNEKFTIVKCLAVMV